MRVAAAQARPLAGDVAANAANAAALIRRAAAAGAQLVVLPELFLCGYELDSIAAEPARFATGPRDARLDPLRAAVDETQTVVVVGAALAAPGGLTNSAIVLAPGGHLLSRYDKQHVTQAERAVFQPGAAGVTTFELDGLRFALGVCYDSSFPEHARAAAVAGAHAYVVPSAFFTGSSDARRAIYLPARALENTMYVVFSNLIGPGFCGRSSVHGPDGAVLAEAPADLPGLAVADLDLSHLAQTREHLTMLRDR